MTDQTHAAPPIKKARLVFMGSPDFSLPVLRAVIDAGHEIAAVYSQPPRPAGRGQKERRCPVHAFAEEQGLRVLTPSSLKGAEDQHVFAELQADAAVVVGSKWGYEYTANWRVNVDDGEAHEVKKHTAEQLARQLDETRALLPRLDLYQ